MSDDALTPDDLSNAWWTFQELSNRSREDRKRLSLGEPPDVCGGWPAARDRIDAGGPDALELVVALVETAADPDAVRLVGAGPLEDPVNDHGAELVAGIEQRARRHAGFRQALGSVSVRPGALDVDTAQRLARWTP